MWTTFTTRIRIWHFAAVSVALFGVTLVTAQPALVDPAIPPAGPPAATESNTNEAVEVLTRGPVHEAFAESLQVDANSQLVVNKQPPDPIEEVPPEVRPEGDNVVWVPGYWAWDDDRKDFLWVSGIYRAAPPNRNWVPGYWAQTANGGWMWTPGFWALAQAQQLEYLPEPPASLDNGPPEAANVRENEYWVPGCWVWRETRYAWRPGYYTMVNPDWVWIPDHYVWTPSGYVYIAGYWDYPVARRGIVFAPVYFHQPVYLHRSYYWRPAVVIETDLISTHLWYRPHCYHYYFGDYYGATYVGLGFRPWYSPWHHHHDPLFSYYRATRGSSWAINIEVGHHFYAQYSDYRPPRTYAAQHAWAEHIARKPMPQVVNVNNKQVNITNINNINVTNVKVAQNVHDVSRRGSLNNLKLEKVGVDTQQHLAAQVKEARTTQAARAQTELKMPVSKGQPVAGFDLKNKSTGAVAISGQPKKFGDGDNRNNFRRDNDAAPGANFGRPTGRGDNTGPTGPTNPLSGNPNPGTSPKTFGRDNPVGRNNPPNITAPGTGNPAGSNPITGGNPLKNNPPTITNPGNTNPPKVTNPLKNNPPTVTNPPRNNPPTVTNPLKTNPPTDKGPTAPKIITPPGGGDRPKFSPGTGNPSGQPSILPRTQPNPSGQPGGGSRFNGPRGNQPKDNDGDRDKGKKFGTVTPPTRSLALPSVDSTPRVQRNIQPNVVSAPKPAVQTPPVLRTNPRTAVTNPPVVRGPARSAVTAPQPSFQKFGSNGNGKPGPKAGGETAKDALKLRLGR